MDDVTLAPEDLGLDHCLPNMDALGRNIRARRAHSRPKLVTEATLGCDIWDRRGLMEPRNG